MYWKNIVRKIFYRVFNFRLEVFLYQLTFITLKSENLVTLQSAHKTEILGSSTVFSIEIWTAANAAQSNSYKMKAIIHWGLCGLILNSFIKKIYALGFLSGKICKIWIKQLCSVLYHRGILIRLTSDWPRSGSLTMIDYSPWLKITDTYVYKK